MSGTQGLATMGVITTPGLRSVGEEAELKEPGSKLERGEKLELASRNRQKKVSRSSHQSSIHHPVSCQDSSLGIQLVARRKKPKGYAP